MRICNSACVYGTISVMPQDGELLTIEETADKLRVNMDTVRRLLRQKKLPGVKIGAQWRVSSAALKAYIEGGGDMSRGE